MGRVTNRVHARLLLTSALFCLTAVAHANGADDTMTTATQGTVSFEVATNVPALRVHGKSSALTARARIDFGPNGFVIEKIEAIVPVQSLDTGMALRDDHMRKYIFTTAAGETPDVQFSSERAECPGSQRGQRASCTVRGELSIRGTARPFVMTLTIIEENGSIRASGHGIVMLSTYGIDQPSQLGVRTTDEVRLKLELTARRSMQPMIGSVVSR